MMDFGMFSTTIDDRLVFLETASDIARFSFLVHDSISYLDLKVCKNSRTSSFFNTLCDNCRSRTLRYFVNTEEKCRLLLAPKRILLYALHLDLPTGRECTLKSYNSKYGSSFGCSRSPHIAKIIISFDFHRNLYSSLVEEALSINIPKEKILKSALKLPFSSESPLFFLLRSQTASKFIDCFYPEATDSTLFRGFIKEFEVVEWMAHYEQPEILEYLLYHGRLLGNKSLEDERNWEYISICIYYKRYLNIGGILKYISDSAPNYSNYTDFLSKLSSERPWLTEDLIDEAAKSKSWERIWRMMQIICVHIDACQYPYQEAAPEALRLIWSSIPDACVTFGELKDVFGTVLDEEELADIHVFYAEAIGEFHEHVEPRSLKQLSRTVLRRTIEENGVWIPVGISRLGLPKLLKSFLNLEKSIHDIIAANCSISYS